MSAVIQALEMINQTRKDMGLNALQTDHRLTRGALYWSALCQGKTAWRTSFSDLAPWSAIESAPLEYQETWILVSTTAPNVEASVGQWFLQGKERRCLTELSHIGLALHQAKQWHWVIYTANPICHKKIWW